MGGEVRWGDKAFQGKGFRSLGQGASTPRPSVSSAVRPTSRRWAWEGDVVAPVIRDIGVALAMRHDAEAVRNVMRRADGQGRPADVRQGSAHRRLRLGRAAGHRAAGHRRRSRWPAWRWRSRAKAPGAWPCRSSGRAARRSANGTRPSTCARRGSCRPSSASRTTRPRSRRRSADNSAARVFADKAPGYGIPGVTIDGTDPEDVAAAFTWAAERARAGQGPTLIEVIVDAHVRPRPPRRHAVPRQGPAAVVGLPGAARRAATRTGSSTTSGRSAIRCRATPRGSRPRA